MYSESAIPRRPSVSTAEASENILHFANLQLRNWDCPLCEFESAESAGSRCARCGAYLIVEDLEALAANKGADERLLTEAIERLKARAAAQPHQETYYNIARAQLNLHRSAEAVTYLRKALELKPSDATLRVLAELLERRTLVMAVDDSAVARRVLSSALNRKGYRVLTAGSGTQALTLLDQYQPSLILLDAAMPGIDGYEVCKTIRRNPSTRNIPVLLLSGDGGFLGKVKRRLAGAVGQIAKPFEEAELAAMVAVTLRR